MKLCNVARLVLCLWVVLVSGCGGGGGGGNGGSTAVVKVATSGTLPAGTRIGGILVHLLANPSTGLSLAAGEVAVSGVGAGSTMVPNVTDVGDVSLGLVNATGILSGEFATLVYHGAAVTAGTFTVAAGASVVDVSGATIPGISVVIQSVTIQ